MKATSNSKHCNNKTKPIITEKVLKTGSAELRAQLPKGFFRVASEITGMSEFVVRQIIIGDRFDDTGFIELVREVARQNVNLHDNIQDMLEVYAEENRLK